MASRFHVNLTCIKSVLICKVYNGYIVFMGHQKFTIECIAGSK